MKNNIFYSLNLDDIQLVAVQEIGRNLTEDEIDKIKILSAEKINWYDAILDSITETVKAS